MGGGKDFEGRGEIIIRPPLRSTTTGGASVDSNLEGGSRLTVRIRKILIDNAAGKGKGSTERKNGSPDVSEERSA